MRVLMKSLINLKIGQVGSKTRSLGQILEKPCVCCRGHIFSQIIMKLGQNVCLDEISDKFKIQNLSLEGSGERLQGHHGRLVI